MNRRQAKKAFKKKYGMNPAEYNRQMDRDLESIRKAIQETDWQEIGRRFAENLSAAIKNLAEALAEGMKNVSEIVSSPEFQEALRRYKEEEEKKNEQ